jgi:hypothetical protein
MLVNSAPTTGSLDSPGTRNGGNVNMSLLDALSKMRVLARL